MVRAVLVGLLAVSTIGCSSKHDAVVSEPGAVAGTVVDVTGTVTIGAKPLAKGDPIGADDLVVTGVDGDVVIELVHNLARWQLGPNKQARANASQAWHLPRKQVAEAVEQDTSAAGRPAERSAATTSIDVPVTSSAPTPSPSPAPAPPPRTRAPSRRMTADDSPPSPSPAPPELQPSPPPKPTPTIGGKGRAVLQALIDALAPCLALGTTIHVSVHDSVLIFPPGLTDAVKTCLDKASAQLALPASDVTFDVTR